MGGTGVNVQSEVLRLAGTGLREVGDELEAQLNSLEAELQSLGDAWGSDDIGQLIGAAVQEVVAWAFDCLSEALNEIRESGVDLGAMADRYEAAEQEITERFNAFLEQLGSR